jgi:O-antigen ligase/polysaccharide polymerase Wzy-like membrane protein
LVLIASTVPALLLYRRQEAKDLQSLIWLGVAYQASLVPTVLLHPYLANAIEWAHELVMVLGGLVVGWVVGRTGHASIALRLYVIGSCIIGVWAFAQGLVMLVQQGAFGPVYLPIYHKNFIGNMLVFALIIAYMRPDWLGWTRRFSYPAIVACAIGIAASGARQAMVSLAVAVVVMSLRPKQGGAGRGRILLLAIAPGLWFVFNSVSDQLDDFSQGDRFNSTAQRLVWFGQSLDIWRESPLFGVGLRWWYTGRFEGAAFQPPNALFEMLSSAGIVGTLGFLVLCLGALWVLLTLPPRYGNLATAIMLARFTQGQLDLYWIAGASSLPWMVAGLAIGVRALEADRGLADALLQSRSTTARTRLGTLPASRFVRQSQSRPYAGHRFSKINGLKKGGR